VADDDRVDRLEARRQRGDRRTASASLRLTDERDEGPGADDTPSAIDALDHEDGVALERSTISICLLEENSARTVYPNPL
jgi:hypothetical protein